MPSAFSFVTLPPVPTSPWWGTTLLAGIFVVLGAVISLIGSFWTDRRKFAREEDQRRAKEVREICAKFSGVIETDFRKMIDTKPTIEDWGWRNNIEVATAWTELQLLAPEDIRKAAHDYYLTYTGMQISFDPTKHGFTEYQRWIRLFMEAQRGYINAVRNQYKLAPLSELSTPQKLNDLMKDA